MEDKRLKQPFGKSHAKLLAFAAGYSVLVHAAVIGGWVLWESTHSGSGVGRATDTPLEIQVQIKRRPPADDAIKIPSNASQDSQVSAAREQAARTQARTAPTPVVSARKALEDPSTGLIFSAYFKAVKAHLARTAAAHALSLDRDVSIHFILSRDGSIRSVSAPAGASGAVQDAAQTFLEAAAPFPPFPSSIRHASIAFDVLFRFD